MIMNEVTKFYNGTKIAFDFDTEMIRATDMLKAYPGIKMNDFFKLDSTKAFIALLKSTTVNPIRIVRGGDPSKQGTWMHKLLAYKFAAWLSPEFELFVYNIFDKAIQNQMTDQQKHLDYFWNKQDQNDIYNTMNIEKFETKLIPLEWYTNKDLYSLSEVQKNIVNCMSEVILLYEQDQKNLINIEISIEKSIKFLCDKGYKDNFSSAIVYKVYFPICDTTLGFFKYYFGTNKREKKEFKTYLIKDSKYYKIGKSSNPTERIYNIQTANISIKTIFIFDIDIESYLHNEYGNKRIQGEWFELTPGDIAKIYKDFKEYEISLTH
jgi:hypothetical protein